jgi:hypothetical protein
MTTPCNLCPFRNDAGRLHVATSRLRGFASGEFCCHKTGETVDSDGDDCGEIVGGKDSQHCAGLLIFLEKQDRPHQMMRICERIGLYDRRKLNMAAPVFGSWAEVTRHEKNRTIQEKEKRPALQSVRRKSAAKHRAPV